MAENYERFGGWLQFFRVLYLLYLIFVFFQIMLYMGICFQPGIHWVSYIAVIYLIICYLANFIVFIAIWIKHPSSPRMIVNLLNFIIKISIAFLIWNFFSKFIEELQPLPIYIPLSKIIQNIVWWIVFAQYLMHSKRVEVYYGKNLDKDYFNKVVLFRKFSYKNLRGIKFKN